MFNVKEKNELIALFTEGVAANLANNCEGLQLEEFMAGNKVDLVRDCVDKIHNNVLAAVPTNVEIPRISLYQSLQGDGEISIIVLTITNCISGTKKFKFSFSATKRNTIGKISAFIQEVYEELILDSLMEANLVRVNEVLAQAVKDAGVGYEIKVVTPMGNKGKKVALMTDNEIHFVADEDNVFALDDILVLHQVEEFVTEEMIQDAFKKEVDAIAEAQTTEQLVEKQGGMLVRYVCDISKLVKPMTIIKKITNKNVENIRGNKDAIVYYNKDGVFALLAKRDGQLEVILSPFDVKTLRKVDLDVLKAVNA